MAARPSKSNIFVSENLKPPRELHPGMGQAVAERTILRKDENGYETWADVAHRVAQGNALLCGPVSEASKEYSVLRRHISNGTILMSGRHLQHGDETQPDRVMEVFTNCATAPASFISFYSLMCGSGVGRSYDDDLIIVDWDNAPSLRCVLSHDHPDFDWSAHESVRDAEHKYGKNSRSVMWHVVPDSREGWAQALEVLEVAAFEKIHKDKMLILDFSKVRPRGSPIKGMQNRPASGPVPLMNAFIKAASLKGSGLKPWKQSMYVDHYFGECVLVGGARRAARMSTKTWRDPDIVDFIQIKRPLEFQGLSAEKVAELRKTKTNTIGFLWSSNNSITVDAEFWRLLDLKRNEEEFGSDIARQVRKIWKELVACAYGDGTGEPGIINADKLRRNDDGMDKINGSNFFGSDAYQPREETELYLNRLVKRARKTKFAMITNPCGEIPLHVLGGFCVIGDVVPYHADTLDEAEEAFRTATRALIRTNTMNSIYQAEVKRTNRIGVSITGIHEFAWKFFQIGFRDLINPDFNEHPVWDMVSLEEMSPAARSAAFWNTMARFRDAVIAEAQAYAKKLGMNVPHTMLTIKPAGTTSKLFGLTEGWHLPSMREYLRWVQFREDDPLVQEYKNKGYPTKKLKSYKDTTIIGFPTAPTITTLGMGDQLVTASEATMEEQYQWIKLGEKYWLGEEYGAQISYTAKYEPKNVDLATFSDILKEHQREVRCCSVMPKEDASSYEYTPEEAISATEYQRILRSIEETMVEDIGIEHVDCESGACPIDFKTEEKAVRELREFIGTVGV